MCGCVCINERMDCLMLISHSGRSLAIYIRFVYGRSRSMCVFGMSFCSSVKALSSVEKVAKIYARGVALTVCARIVSLC